MLLKIGAVSMAVSLAAAALVAVLLSLRDSPARAEPEPVADTTVERAVAPREEAVPPQPEPERPRPEAVPPQPLPERSRPEAVPPQPEPERPRPEAAPLSEEGWDRPSGEEVAVADGPRRYSPGDGVALTLTVPALQIYDVPVFDSDSPDALNQGIAHVPETSMPWDGGAQRNVYLAAHRIGYAGTGSRLIFYHLDRLKEGDEVVLRGRGETYRYRVSEAVVVPPTASWVMGQVRNRDMVSLQTCVPIPTFEKRLVVRADRV